MCILFPLTFRIRRFRYFQCVTFRVTLNGALTSCDVACRARFLILSFIETHGNKEQSEKDRKHNRFLGIEVVIMAKIALRFDSEQSWLLVVTRGQSPPDLIVSTVKYILQRLSWVFRQRICCTDLAMLCSFAVH